MLTKKRAIPLFNFLIAQRVAATFITVYLQSFALAGFSILYKIKAPRQKSGSFPLYGLNFLRHRVFSMALTCWVAPF